MNELPCHKIDREAGERLEALIAKPNPEHDYDLGADEFFDPWSLFPLYGSYSSDFDELAIEILAELQTGQSKRSDLAAEIFREMLCNLNFCDYGSSPRVCFPTKEFRQLLPEFIEKWKSYSSLQWQVTAQ